MDIYKYAKEINYGADYYEMSTGRIYHIQDYGLALKRGLPTRGIAVSEDGKIIGYAVEKGD
jgi:hypothetical protein